MTSAEAPKSPLDPNYAGHGDAERRHREPLEWLNASMTLASQRKLRRSLPKSPAKDSAGPSPSGTAQLR
jgi:hypothetical protein